MHRTLTLTLVLVVATVPALRADELDDYITSRMAAVHAPGLAAAVVRDGAVVWAHGYGSRDLGSGEPVGVHTPFMLASVSKLVTATALMMLWEDGAFDLDDAVEAHLEFAVRNPDHPGQPLTFRQLLAHTSSIQDNWDVLEPLIVDGDSPTSLGALLAGYLVPGGAWYDGGWGWASWAPGSRFEYSNVGYALVGHLVERLADMPFDRFCEQRIFEPLGMADSGWFLADFPDPAVIAVPYEWSGGSHQALAHYGYPDYPNGQLRSSAADMGCFMAMHAAGGIFAGQRLLEASTVELMQTVAFPALEATQGLGFYWETHGGAQVVGHNGGDLGAATNLFFDPATGTGALVMANIDPANAQPLSDVLERLLAEASTLVGSPVFRDGFESGATTAWEE